MSWKHDDLAEDLAASLRGGGKMVWTDMQLGPAGSPRPDVFTMRKSFSKPMPLAYEIKISVSDFRSDITKGKWQNYLDYAQAVTFCVPKGLITKLDLPAGCGLMVRTDNGWHTSKKATLNPMTEPDGWMMLKLLMDGLDRLPTVITPRDPGDWHQMATKRKLLGEVIADKIQQLSTLNYREENFKTYIKDLKKALDLKGSPGDWDLQRKIENITRKAQKAFDEDLRVNELLRRMERIAGDATQHLESYQKYIKENGND